jgi:hypothetical protein
MDIVFSFKFLSIQMVDQHGFPNGVGGVQNRHFIFRELYTRQGHTALELASGEVLFTPEEFRSRLTNQTYDNEPIWADLYYIDNGEAVEECQMEYYDNLGSVRSHIRICIYASRSQYEDLLANVRSGLIPTSIDVKVAEGSQYWQSTNHDQQYSRMIWKHEGYITEQFEPAVVPIEAHAFHYVITGGN